MVDGKPKVTSTVISYTLPEHLAARRGAQRRDNVIQIVGGVLGLVCFLGAGWLLTPINRIRQERQLVINPEQLGTLPPHLSLVSKLGTFRALVICWASIRAERLKEDGKYYEALQLHEMVCALAPRFASVWDFAAWNMAYNISVCQYTPEARWQWVSNGLNLLRDKGIRFNPKSVTLYKALSWTYRHKIGDYLDDHHVNYKRALAVEMERVLGPPPITLTDDEYFSWFKKMVSAPRDLHAFIAADESVERLVFQIESVGLAPDESLLEFVSRYLRPVRFINPQLSQRPEAADRLRKQMALLTDEQNADAMDRLVSAVRSDVLRKRLKFDLDKMLALMELYGPLDWRNAFAHSLYWSSLGDELSRTHANINIHDQLNNARFIFHALGELVVHGRISLRPDFDDPFASTIDLTPDTRFIPYLYEAYLRLGKEHYGDDEEFIEDTPGPIYIRGLINAMHGWISLLYLEGGERNMALAEQYYLWLRKFNKHPDGSTQARYLVSVEELVVRELVNQLQVYRNAAGMVHSFVLRGLKQFSLGQTKQGVLSLTRARRGWDIWMKDIGNDIRERRKLRPFVEMVRDDIEGFMTKPEVAAVAKASLWMSLRRLQPELCQMTYDRLKPYFDRLCAFQKPPWDVADKFTEPPGMESFRRRELAGRGRREGEIDADEGSRRK